jgi:superfamily I DNA/RNA helicase
MTLNAKQKHAVTCEDPLLVVACPGSGKSRVVVEKVDHILKNHPDPKIIVCTFSREGANELKHRLASRVGEEKANSVFIATFHSLALNHLKRHRIRFRIAKESETRDFLVRAIAQTGLALSFEEASILLQNCKTVPHFEPLNDEAGRIYSAYQALCEKNQIVDFFDIMLMSLKLIREGSMPVLNATHMLVDEFQDCDEIQYQYMMEHVRSGKVTVTCVGDDDQAIYAFRNSLGFDGMARFEREANAVRITLDTNYRCHSEILTPAARLIEYNQDRMDKRLMAHRGRGGTLTVHRYPDPDDEAMAVIKKIFESYGYGLIENDDDVPMDVTLPVQRGDWAILARTNSTLFAVETMLRVHSIPYNMAGKSSWERAPVSHAVTLLKSLTAAKKTGIENILYWAGISNESLDLIHERLETDFSNIFKRQFMEKVEFDDIDADDRKTLLSFIEHAPGWAKNAKKTDDESADLVIKLVFNWMTEHCTRKADLQKLDVARSILLRLRGSLSNRLQLVTKTQEKDTNGVALITMHASKGLEFTNVWIIRSEESIIPSNQNGPLTPSFIEEERRLMYVAMTRAKDHLYISSTNENNPSPFISEAINRA